jgi:hypothetical protein
MRIPLRGTYKDLIVQINSDLIPPSSISRVGLVVGGIHVCDFNRFPKGGRDEWLLPIGRSTHSTLHLDLGEGSKYTRWEVRVEDAEGKLVEDKLLETAMTFRANEISCLYPLFGHCLRSFEPSLGCYWKYVEGLCGASHNYKGPFSDFVFMILSNPRLGILFASPVTPDTCYLHLELLCCNGHCFNEDGIIVPPPLKDTWPCLPWSHFRLEDSCRWMWLANPLRTEKARRKCEETLPPFVVKILTDQNLIGPGDGVEKRAGRFLHDWTWFSYYKLGGLFQRKILPRRALSRNNRVHSISR